MTSSSFSTWEQAVNWLRSQPDQQEFIRACYFDAPLRAADVGQTDYQLLIDVRRFRIAADSEPTVEIGLSARLLDKNGKVVASRLFEESQKLDRIEPPAAVDAFNSAFDRIAKEMIGWTVQAL